MDDGARFGGNLVLRALLAVERERWGEHLRWQDCAAGDVLLRHGDPVEEVFFPVSGRFGRRPPVSSGPALDVEVVGREGALGIADALGTGEATAEVVCLAPGQAAALARGALLDAVRRPGARELVARHLQAVTAHLAQKVVCARRHETVPRLATCLLQEADRSATPTVRLTHRSVATAMGLRRETVSLAAGGLQDDGVISYRHGQLTVTDRAGLEAAAEAA